MKSSYLLALAIATASLVSLPPLPLQSQGLPATFQGSAPRLEEVRSSSTRTYSSRAKYYFTITLPDTAETSLQGVVIQQRGGQERIRFKLEDTMAFLGTSRDRGEPLTIQSMTYDESTLTIMVELEEAIPPGTTMSIRLKPRRNPRWGGVYGFGVAVFPEGENGRELYLGSRRLTFYERLRPRF
ncbi:MAG: DUF2808 domain-containing protein [Spirulina sp.]